jgi:2-hydroxychromene-2-carboxylate isomerase
MKVPLEFWFDFGSTYSYPAAMRAEELAKAHNVVLKWRPFLLGPVMKMHGHSGTPADLPAAKLRYIWRDAEQICAFQGIEFRRPSTFPRSGLLAARVALCGTGTPWEGNFIRAVFDSNFSKDREIADAEVIEEILGTLGLDAKQILAAARSERIKELLRQRTTVASGLGIFGAPTSLVGQELFWGQDRLEQAFRWASTSSLVPGSGSARDTRAHK